MAERIESSLETYVEVRPMKPGDVDEFLDLLEIVAAEKRYIGPEAPIDREAKRQRYLDIIEADNWVSLVAAERNQAIVGQIWLKDIRGLVEIGMLVAPERRGRGIGSALLHAALDWARARNAHKITLQLWPDNEAAHQLYRKFGFVQEGHLRRQWKRRNGEIWDSIIMGLQLHQSPSAAAIQGDQSPRRRVP